LKVDKTESRKYRKMSQRNFITLPKKECLSEAKLIIANAEKKARSAEAIATSDPGGAVGFLIISTEEMVKALILTLDSNGFKFREVAGMDNLFKNHRLRYLVALIFAMFGLLSEDLKTVTLEAQKDLPRLMRLFKNPRAMEVIVKRYLFMKIEQFQGEIKFFERMDTMRQIGFYTDAAQNVPINEQEYHVVRKRLITIQEVMKGIMVAYATDNDVFDKIKIRFQKQMKTEGWYDKLGDLVKRINKPNVNSYEALANSLSNFSEDIRSGQD
tara:strand:+ start:435 stop:1244 length:810 start_codon:yes stop_codon:yes gene_type:complete